MQTQVIDLRPTIVPRSDQLNSDDLIGRTLTIKITAVKACGEPTQPIALCYEGDNGKPYKPCKSMRRVMVKVWGGNSEVVDAKKFIGRRLTLYRDDGVQFGGLAVGGIRISHMSDIDREIAMVLTESRANRRPFTVRPLPPEQGGVGPSVDLLTILLAGRTAAKAGSAALTAWWGGLSKAEKAAAKPVLDAEMKATAAAADLAALGDEDAEDSADDGFPGDRGRLTLAGRVQAFKEEVKAGSTSGAMRALRQNADQLFRDVDAGDPDEVGVTSVGLDKWFSDQLADREEAEKAPAQGGE